jgi:hypothetical protein
MCGKNAFVCTDASNDPSVPHLVDYWVWIFGCKMTGTGSRCVLSKTCPNSTLCATKLTHKILGSIPCPSEQNPANKHVSYIKKRGEDTTTLCRSINYVTLMHNIFRPKLKKPSSREIRITKKQLSLNYITSFFMSVHTV